MCIAYCIYGAPCISFYPYLSLYLYAFSVYKFLILVYFASYIKYIYTGYTNYNNTSYSNILD